MPLLIALCSAVLFAVGSALQHRSAGSAPRSSKSRMMIVLARRPGWLLGAAACAGAFGLQAVALKLGEISLVQSVLLTGIVFTVVARSALDRRMPSPAELGWVAVTWAGLALFIAALPPGDERPAQPSWAAIMVAGGLAVVAVLAYLARRHQRPVTRSVLLGSASGILFGLVAGLLKLTGFAADRGLLHVLSQWSFWILIAVGGWAVLLSQRAYQAAVISVSTSVLNICQLLVALTFGVVVFGEQLMSSSISTAAEIAGLMIMLIGVTKLASRAADRPRPTDSPHEMQPQNAADASDSERATF